MSRQRARSTKKIDSEARYPVRIRIPTPEMGWGYRLDEMYDWLRLNVGPDRWQSCTDTQPGHDATAWYFETLEDAKAFQDRFGLPLLLREEVKVPGMGPNIARRV